MSLSVFVSGGDVSGLETAVVFRGWLSDMCVRCDNRRFYSKAASGIGFDIDSDCVSDHVIFKTVSKKHVIPGGYLCHFWDSTFAGSFQ